MSETLRHIQELIARGDVRVSDHGYDELDADGILAADALDSVASAVLVEDYPDRARGPSVLTLQYDASGQPIHVVWALPAGVRRPAVLVTAYRPDPARWDSEFKRRRKA
jgi:Domain of unknown function (DUF4258)